MLKLHGNILPENVPANEFMNLEGDKMSTSRGWSIEMEEYINDWIKKDNGGESMADVLTLLPDYHFAGNKRQRVYMERFPGCQ